MNTQMMTSIFSKTKKILVALLFLIASAVNANNLNISAPTISGSNLTFTISWENSWYLTTGPSNWDAAWVFVKYQDCPSGLWYHANLSTTSGDHSTSSPLLVDAVSDGKGVFVHRSAAGSGNISSTTVTLKLNIPAGTYNFKVFGIEMVHIPQGAFDIGDGTSTGTFNSVSIDASYQTNGIASSTLGGGGSLNVPSTFPMGYNTMYCMKHEFTNQQYVDFLNTLTYNQQATRAGTNPNNAVGSSIPASNYRIEIMTSGVANAIPAVFACDYTNNNVFNASDDGQNIACSNLTWSDMMALLDWTALRPMTEMEYEKICRGTQPRIAGEYPWGTNINAVNATSMLSPGAANATAVPSNANLARLGYGVRVGFAATSSSSRTAAGASYYGVLHMADNLGEATVPVFTTTGIAYTGELGDGTLTSTGNANANNWNSTYLIRASNYGIVSWREPTTYTSGYVGVGLRGVR